MEIKDILIFAFAVILAAFGAIFLVFGISDTVKGEVKDGKYDMPIWAEYSLGIINLVSGVISALLQVHILEM